MSSTRSQWRSFPGYVAVTTGAVIGLGNIFQFPFLATKYGGLFLLFYFLCQLLIGLPLLFAELLMGRRGKQNPIGAIGILTLEADANPRWRFLGRFCVLIAFLTLCYYTVSAAFPVGYFASSITSLFNSTDVLENSLQLSTAQISSFSHLEVCFIIFLLLAMIVVYRGVNRGLEELSLIIVPFYCCALVLLAIYISTQGYFNETLQSLVTLHYEFPLFEIFFAALTLAFLKYGTGMGVMIVYGSYLPYHVPLTKSTLMVVAIDALVSITAYFIVYPLLLSVPYGNIEELNHHNVLTIFSIIPHGVILSAFFFFIAILIAWTPIIAMAETIVMTLMERLDWTRRKASIITMVAAFFVGTFVVVTHMDLAEVIVFGNYHLHNSLRDITLNFLTPTAAFLIAIFAGWVMKRSATQGELRFKPGFYGIWRFLIRYVIPVAIVGVLVLHILSAGILSS